MVPGSTDPRPPSYWPAARCEPVASPRPASPATSARASGSCRSAEAGEQAGARPQPAVASRLLARTPYARAGRPPSRALESMAARRGVPTLTRARPCPDGGPVPKRGRRHTAEHGITCRRSPARPGAHPDRGGHILRRVPPGPFGGTSSKRFASASTAGQSSEAFRGRQAPRPGLPAMQSGAHRRRRCVKCNRARGSARPVRTLAVVVLNLLNAGALVLLALMYRRSGLQPPTSWKRHGLSSPRAAGHDPARCLPGLSRGNRERPPPTRVPDMAR